MVTRLRDARLGIIGHPCSGMTDTGSNEVDSGAIADQYRRYLRMKSMGKADRLDGLTVRGWPELRDQHRLTVCLILSGMAGAGIPNACEQALQLAHCGSAALSLAGGPKCPAIRGHMRTGAGALVEFGFKPGPVTISKLLQPQDGRMKMFAGRGEVIATAPEIRGSVATIPVEPSSALFFDTLIREAVKHHLVIVCGDWTAELTKFCEFSGIEIVRPH